MVTYLPMALVLHALVCDLRLLSLVQEHDCGIGDLQRTDDTTHDLPATQHLSRNESITTPPDT